MKVTSVQVSAVRPGPADSRQLDFLRATRAVPVEDHYFIVKLYLEGPFPRRAEAPRLFVGDEEVTKYHGFPGGVFFKVYDPGFFDRHQDQPISFFVDNDRVDSGVKMPGRQVPQARARPLSEVGQPTDSSTGASAEALLPTKTEVLRQ